MEIALGLRSWVVSAPVHEDPGVACPRSTVTAERVVIEESIVVAAVPVVCRRGSQHSNGVRQ
jgi:hypothetical protein